MTKLNLVRRQVTWRKNPTLIQSKLRFMWRNSLWMKSDNRCGRFYSILLDSRKVNRSGFQWTTRVWDWQITRKWSRNRWISRRLGGTCLMKRSTAMTRGFLFLTCSSCLQMHGCITERLRRSTRAPQGWALKQKNVQSRTSVEIVLFYYIKLKYCSPILRCDFQLNNVHNIIFMSVLECYFAPNEGRGAIDGDNSNNQQY